MYIFDTTLLWAFGRYYPAQFPSIWKRVDELIGDDNFRSVREVKREIENNCPFEHISVWVKTNHRVFRTPGEEESAFIAEIFRKEQYRGLVRRQKMLKGLPVADPFVIAAAKVHQGCVITDELRKKGAARIPTLCQDFGIECINVEELLNRENLKY
jgi:uncharacterized protein DUF4411